MSQHWAGPTNSWSELALQGPSWPRSLASGWTTRYGTQHRSYFDCLISAVSWSVSSLKVSRKAKKLTYFLAILILWRTSQHVLLFIRLFKISKLTAKADPIIFSSFYQEDEVPHLFKNDVSCILLFSPSRSTLRRTTRSSTKLKSASF